jgi:hypothetical protein
MTGPELDQGLEAIGRRLSPRLGAAHDAVVARAAREARGRRPRTALPWPGRLGGAALTLAFTAGFTALLAVGVADRPANLDLTPPSSSANGPMALAPVPGTSGASGSPGGAPVRPPRPALPTVPTQAPPRVAAPPPVAAATSAPRGSDGGPAVPSAPPSDAPQAPSAPTPTQDPGPHPAPTAPARVTPGPPGGRAPMRIVLTEKDSGRTITVHRGDVVEVDLSAPVNGSRWTEPQSTDQTVARRTSGAAQTDGSAYAVFGAAGDGNARVWASRMPACSFSTPRCYPPVGIDFQVTIVVTG